MGDRTVGSTEQVEGGQVMRLVALLLAVFSALTARPAFAWGEFGHHTTASSAVAELLRAERGLGTAYCRVRSLEEASYWPDCIRREGWRWGYSFTWHYQTMNVCKPYDPRANCAGGNCVTGQIERNRRILADKSLPAAQRLEALAWLTHFVGDLHMPLHSGDNDDRGGNDVAAKYGIAPGRNLHAIWDGPLAERGITSAVPPLIRRYNLADRAALDTGDTADWGRESWQLARSLVYAKAFERDPCEGGEVPKDVVWSNEDIEASLPTLRQRISQAGLRLARLLDGALAG
jgi:hypothetical protein